MDDLINSGWKLHQQGKIREAEQLYRQAIAANSSDGVAWCFLGMSLHDQERFGDALLAYQQSLTLQPHLPATYQNLGKTLGRLRRFDEAIACFDQAMALTPNYLNAYKNKARALYFKGDLAAAAAVHRQALTLAPGDVETHMNLGMLALMHGDIAKGWPEYAWRWKTTEGALPQVPQPLWDGSSLCGKSILLTPEQGLGDSIQFIRYALILKQRFGCRVVFQSPRSLLELLATCPGLDQLVASSDPIPATDYYAPLLHVPAMLGHGPADFPDIGPYLSPREDLVRLWRERLPTTAQFKVAISWRGSPKHPIDRMRSFPLAEFAAIARLPHVKLFSVQKGAGVEELNTLAGPLGITDLGKQLDETTGAFVETSAVLQNVDLVIACDTALIHVAGALGVPVWVAVTRTPDWRWLLGRSDSPAYPTLRLFRQSEFGDWSSVFAAMAQQLASFSPTR